MAEEHKKHEHKAHEDKEHDEKAHVYMEHKHHAKSESYKVTTWILAGVSALLLIGLILALTLGGSKGVSSDAAKAQVETYLNSIAAGQATVDSITDVGDLYQVKLTVAGRQYDSYLTKNGKLLFPQGIDLTTPVDTGSNTPANSANTAVVNVTPSRLPKTDKPVVELFVMAYCPFGTQAEKGILPAVRALGNTVDFKIRFVYYAMHGEKEVKENLNQYCIQSEQPDKYLKYLACFLNDSAGQGSDAAVTSCIASSGIDTTKLDACKVATDTEFGVMQSFNDRASWLSGNYPKFNVDAALNTKYSVGGSPTLVINGKTTASTACNVDSDCNIGEACVQMQGGKACNLGRDSASYLKAICAAFNNAPAECQAQLSSVSPGPGFGYDSVGAANAAGCGV